MNYYEIHVCLRFNLANVQGLHESLKLMQLDHNFEQNLSITDKRAQTGNSGSG